MKTTRSSAESVFRFVSTGNELPAPLGEPEAGFDYRVTSMTDDEDRAILSVLSYDPERRIGVATRFREDRILGTCQADGEWYVFVVRIDGCWDELQPGDRVTGM